MATRKKSVSGKQHDEAEVVRPQLRETGEHILDGPSVLDFEDGAHQQQLADLIKRYGLARVVAVASRLGQYF